MRKVVHIWWTIDDTLSPPGSPHSLSVPSSCLETCRHTGCYTILMSHSELNGPKLTNATSLFSFPSSTVPLWWAELNWKPILTLVTAQIFGKSDGITGTGVVLCRIKQAQTRHLENEIMRQTRTDEAEDKGRVEPKREEKGWKETNDDQSSETSTAQKYASKQFHFSFNLLFLNPTPPHVIMTVKCLAALVLVLFSKHVIPDWKQAEPFHPHLQKFSLPLPSRLP